MFMLSKEALPQDAKGGETADDVDDFISELAPDTDLGDLLAELDEKGD